MSEQTITRLKAEIDRIISRSTTKLISPLLMLFYLDYVERKKNPVVENDYVKEGYYTTICNFIRKHLHHNFNIGGEFNNTYISRLSSRHRFLRQMVGMLLFSTLV